MADKEKTKKPRTTKTPKELEAAHIEKVQKCVQNVDKWMNKLAKVVSSRKYDIGTDKKEFIVQHLNKKNLSTVEIVRGKKLEVEQFKLT